MSCDVKLSLTTAVKIASGAKVMTAVAIAAVPIPRPVRQANPVFDIYRKLQCLQV